MGDAHRVSELRADGGLQNGGRRDEVYVVCLSVVGLCLERRQPGSCQANWLHFLEESKDGPNT